MDSKNTPVSIDVSNSDQKITIEWGDGHKTILTLFGLRKNCPCVSCRGGHELMGRFEPALFLVEPTRHFEVVKADLIGNHALKIKWSDGHDAGMYRWELVRHMDDSVQKLME